MQRYRTIHCYLTGLIRLFLSSLSDLEEDLLDEDWLSGKKVRIKKNCLDFTVFLCLVILEMFVFSAYKSKNVIQNIGR